MVLLAFMGSLIHPQHSGWNVTAVTSVLLSNPVEVDTTVGVSGWVVGKGSPAPVSGSRV